VFGRLSKVNASEDTAAEGLDKQMLFYSSRDQIVFKTLKPLIHKRIIGIKYGPMELIITKSYE